MIAIIATVANGAVRLSICL